MKFPFIYQYDQMDCGPACVSMVAKNYGKNYSLQYIRNISFIAKDGVSLRGISNAAQELGFDTFSAQLTIEQLIQHGSLPSIIYWNQNHFVVLYEIKKRFFSKNYLFRIADPSHGLVTLSEEQFKKSWLSAENQGIALFLNTTDKFYKKQSVTDKPLNFNFLWTFLKPYKFQVFQLFLGLLAGSLFTLIFPFLTQALMDKGVAMKSLPIVTTILLAQVFLFMGSIIIEVVRNWVMLYIGTRINITIISDFLRKILRLPIQFFDTKMIGDFSQRITDHENIEDFLTAQSLTTLFSFINFSVFFLVLLSYDTKVVIAYLGLTILAILWSLFFLQKRKRIDYNRFQIKAENQDSIFEIFNGVQEIKLNRFENYKRRKWEEIQVRLFKVNLQMLRLDQVQIVGFDFINQLKNILVTFIAVSEVIKGHLSLGAMLSISYIIGQLNAPINQLITFFRSFQAARLSMERLNEVQNQMEEESAHQIPLPQRTDKMASEEAIYVKNLSFQYGGPTSPFILKEIHLKIPNGKITAIVGASGSGKTTLMKLFLKFYEPTQGAILINGKDLNTVSAYDLRKNCGAVMQEGYIFAETMERNIATGAEDIDYGKLNHAIKVSNIQEFIDSLPLGLKTKLGSSGNGISGGQKQRILIARAVYKNPQFIFLDEATSALDAENEKIIHKNLQFFFKGKTVVVIAHRLSTVKEADQIIVLKKGVLMEQGKHLQLIAQKGEYYNLVKNQLELDH
jgi:ATP-binding cassette, subfamily B, bacterial